MRYILLVAWREFAENAKTKGFWIGIFLFPLIIYVSISAQKWLEKATPVRNYVLVDPSQEFEDVIERGLERRHRRRVFEAFGMYVVEHAVDRDMFDPAAQGVAQQAQIRELSRGGPQALMDQFEDIDIDGLVQMVAPMLREGAPEFVEPRRAYRRVQLPEELADIGDFDELGQALKPYLLGEEKITTADGERELFAALIVPPDVLRDDTVGGDSKVRYWSSNLAADELSKDVRRLIDDELRGREFLALGVESGDVARIRDLRVPFKKLNPKKKEGEEGVSTADVIRQWAPVAFVYLLWIAIFTISQMLLNNTIEEKSNRIIEVLLSSVTAGELMLGKLFGIAAVGLTMLTAWIGSLVIVLWLKSGPEASIANELFGVLRDSNLLPAFVFYFLLGYLMYAGIFLAIGSLCNTLKEAQNLMGPVMLIMMVPLITMMFIPKDPNGVLARTMSWIPIYTPFAMMNRAGADPPLFDWVGTSILLIVSTLVVLWLTGRVFRIGILRTGQPPKIVELLRWLRAGVG